MAPNHANPNQWPPHDHLQHKCYCNCGDVFWMLLFLPGEPPDIYRQDLMVINPVPWDWVFWKRLFCKKTNLSKNQWSYIKNTFSYCFLFSYSNTCKYNIPVLECNQKLFMICRVHLGICPIRVWDPCENCTYCTVCTVCTVVLENLWAFDWYQFQAFLIWWDGLFIHLHWYHNL